MRGPYVPSYALDLDQLVAVWGGGRVAPLEDWRGLVSSRQRDVLGGDLAAVELVLRDVAAGRPFARPRTMPRGPALNAGHAIELWASWLGYRVEFVGESRWVRRTHEDTDIGALDWIERQGVKLDLGLRRSPWPVALPAENPIVRITRHGELQQLHAQLVALARNVPTPMRTAHAALTDLYEQRAQDGRDLVEMDWT